MRAYMKSLVLLIIITLSMVACGDVPDSRVEPPHTIEMDCNGDGKCESMEIKEYVIGDFNGDGNKEYAALYYYKELSPDSERYDNGDYYKYSHYNYIIFGDTAIATIILEWCASNLVNEGDLDGNGTEDIGYLEFGGYSYWGVYSTHSYCLGKWQELVAISHNEDWNTAPYQDLVQKSSSKENTLVVMEIQVEEGGIISREVLINR